MDKLTRQLFKLKSLELRNGTSPFLSQQMQEVRDKIDAQKKCTRVHLNKVCK